MTAGSENPQVDQSLAHQGTAAGADAGGTVLQPVLGEVCCPALGLREDRDTHFFQAAYANNCFVAGRPRAIPLPHQSVFCLTSDYERCPLYRGVELSADQSLFFSVEQEGRRYTVLEMDRNRIAKVRVEKVGQ